MIKLIICNPLKYLCDNLSGNNSAQLRSATSKNKLILLASTGLIFKGFYRVKKSSVQGQQLQRGSQKFFWKVGCSGLNLDLLCVRESDAAHFYENYAELYFDTKGVEQGVVKFLVPFLDNIGRYTNFLDQALMLVSWLAKKMF